MIDSRRNHNRPRAPSKIYDPQSSGPRCGIVSRIAFISGKSTRPSPLPYSQIPTMPHIFLFFPGYAPLCAVMLYFTGAAQYSWRLCRRFCQLSENDPVKAANMAAKAKLFRKKAGKFYYNYLSSILRYDNGKISHRNVQGTAARSIQHALWDAAREP